MDPKINTPRTSADLAPPPDSEKERKYAQALIQSANLEYKLDHMNEPKSRGISNKKLIYIGLSILVTIISLIAGPSLFQDDAVAPTNDSAEKLLESSNSLLETVKE